MTTVISKCRDLITRQGLERFAVGTATAEERRAVARHLLIGCAECTAALREILRGGERPSPEQYQAAIDGAMRRVTAELGVRSPAPAVLLLAELDRQPEARRTTMVRNLSRFWSLPLLAALVDRSFAQRHVALAPMLADAQMATEVAEALLRHEAHCEPATADVIVQAWSQLGNALRSAGRLAEADAAFARAHELRDQLPVGLVARAILDDRFATLRKDQRRFAEAREHFTRAAAAWRSLNNSAQLGRTLLNLALNTFWDGDAAGCLDLLLEASPLLDVRAEPSLATVALLLAVIAHLDEDQPEEALQTFLLGQELFRAQDQPLAVLKTRWTEAKLLAALGHLSAARSQLEDIREDYVAQGQHYNCALVALDLAGVLAKMGAFAEVRNLISASLPVFKALHVDQETLAAIILLTQADRQQSYVEVLNETARRLERDPVALDLAAAR